MKRNATLLTILTIVSGAALGYVAARAQQGAPKAQPTTPPLGSPAATTTVDGNYLPNPPPKFGGTINLNAKDSKPW